MECLQSVYAANWRLLQARIGPGVAKILAEAEAEAALSPAAWEQLRRERLRRLLVHAQRHVPYYRRQFARCGFDAQRAELPGDLARLPLLSKDVLRENLAEMVSENVDRRRIVENATGGSTGSPVRFYQDAAYRATGNALDAYVRSWWQVRPWDRTAAVWGADREFHELSWRERFYQWRSRVRTLNAFRMTAAELQRFCAMLRRWRPPHLMGYASALDTLARFAEERKIDGLRFRAVRSAAETLWPHQRERIEKALQSPVYNFYGSRETNCLAAECPQRRRMHLISTWRYLEIVDEHGRPLAAGQPGYVAVTDLSNLAMPLVRYRNDDVARLSPEPCPCGRPMPALEELLGRSSDLIRTTHGELIHGEFFTHLFYGRGDIRQFQVHQTALDRLALRYVAAADSAHAFVEEVAAKVRGRMGPATEVTVEACGEIPLPPSGKHRFTISDIPFSASGIAAGTAHDDAPRG